MRLILEVQAGPAAGRTVVVSPDQPFYVGRTESAYLALSNDRKMAPSHFAIEGTKEGYWVRDLSGRYGTFVNGDKVSRAALRNGDVITAGESKFLVRLEQGAPATAPVKPAGAAAAPAAPAGGQPAKSRPASPAQPGAPAPTAFDPQLIREFDAKFNAGQIPLDDTAKLLTEAVKVGDAVATWPQRKAIESHLDVILASRKPQDVQPLTKGAKIDWLGNEVATAMLFVILSVVKGRLMAARAKEEAESQPGA